MRGRPKNKEVQICKKTHCQRPAKRDKAYCCRDHAPFSHLLDRGDSDENIRLSKYSNESQETAIDASRVRRSRSESDFG